MNILDIILGIFLLVLLFHGLTKGFIRSAISLISLIVIVILIAKSGHIFKGILMVKLGLSELIAIICSYILIAVVIVLIAKLTIKILQMVIEFLHLKWLDRLLGAFFGVFNGTMIIAIVLLLLNLLPFEKQIRNFTSSSTIANNIRIATDKIELKYPGLKEKIQSVGKDIDENTEKIEKLIKDKTTK
ncbi:MAG: CvpA family protein [Candidatus Cloacimonetes bacterium]|jgi:membrane protein required for colicin V production|nr:CvpA family protein [Candidatus Cloacimonadota bacterium]MBT5419593.1 CvpA family protein [Candidatus Cloacimonadota bacterium]